MNKLETTMTDGNLSINLGYVTIAPENDDQGIWFRWTVDTPNAGPESGWSGETGGCEIVDCVSGAIGSRMILGSVRLDEESLTILGTSIVAIQAYVGDTGDSQLDECVGKGFVPLSDILVKHNVDCHVVMKNEKEENAESLQVLTIQVDIDPDERLLAFLKGGKVLSVDDLVISNLSNIWKGIEAESSIVAQINDTDVFKALVSVSEDGESLSFTESKCTPIYISDARCQEIIVEGCPIAFSISDPKDEIKILSSGMISIDGCMEIDCSVATVAIDRFIHSVVNEEGELIHSLNGALTLSINPPLNPRPKTPLKVLLKPRDVIDARQTPEKLPLKGQALLEKEIENITGWNADEFRLIVEQAQESFQKSETNEYPLEKRHAQYYYSLNSSGKYNAIRDRVRLAIGAFLQEQPKQEMNPDLLIIDLYERVMQVVHTCLNRKFEESSKLFISNQFGLQKRHEREDDTMEEHLRNLESLAIDAIFENQLARADLLLQQRVGDVEKWMLVSDNWNPDPKYWFEYGVFCLTRGVEYQGVAAECLRNCIAIDDTHSPTLMTYGALLVEVGTDQNQAEIFLAAVNDSGYHLVAARGILCLMTQRLDTSPATAADTVQKAYEMKVSETVAEVICLTTSIEVCLQLNLPYVSQALIDRRKENLAKLQVDDNTPAKLHQSNTRLFDGWLALIRDDTVSAVTLLQQSINLHPESILPYILLGKIQSEDEACKALLEKGFALMIEDSSQTRYHAHVPDVMKQFLFLHLGRVYLTQGLFPEAKEILLQMCQKWPTAAAWTGVGVACFHEENLPEALDGFTEANIIDRENVQVWYFLALTCERLFAATRNEDYSQLGELSLHQARETGSSPNAALLVELSECLAKNGKLKQAQQTLETALKIPGHQGNFQTKLELAKVLLTMSNFEQAVSIAKDLSSVASDAESKSEVAAFLQEFKAKLH